MLALSCLPAGVAGSRPGATTFANELEPAPRGLHARSSTALLASGGAGCSDGECNFVVALTTADAADVIASEEQFLCHQAPAGGVTLTVSSPADSKGAENVVLWDEDDEVCGGGMFNVHYVHGQPTVPLKAEGGSSEVHSYKAAFYDPVPVSKTGCQSFEVVGVNSTGKDSLKGYSDAASQPRWQVARSGASCPTGDASADDDQQVGSSK